MNRRLISNQSSRLRDLDPLGRRKDPALSWRAREKAFRFSPDGKWMAFVSDETGEYQVYVTVYPGPGSTVGKGRIVAHQREDVAPDGRFLMVENSDDFPIVIV